jgi:hypothetical protein
MGMHRHDERRKDRRFATELPVEVKVLSCKSRPDLEGTQCRCTTVDAAVCGMQLQTEVPLPQGARLEITVQLLEGGKTTAVQLVGDVIWTNQFPKIGTVAGVFLHDRPHRAMRVWMDTITEQVKKRFSAGNPAAKGA